MVYKCIVSFPDDFISFHLFFKMLSFTILNVEALLEYSEYVFIIYMCRIVFLLFLLGLDGFYHEELFYVFYLSHVFKSFFFNYKNCCHLLIKKITIKNIEFLQFFNCGMKKDISNISNIKQNNIILLKINN